VAGALRPTSAAAREKLRRVLAGEGFAVTTGQQAGLFGGPLYTLYKILSAVRLASAVENVLGAPVVPMFWIAADDHDFAEVDHTFMIDSGNALARITLASPPDAPPVPMSERVTGEGITHALDAFIAGLPASEFAAPLIELLRRVWTPSASVARAFGDQLAGMLADMDVVLVDPSHPDLKAAAAPLLLHELEHTGAHAALLRERSDALVGLGYHEQVTIAVEAANVFYHDASGRDRLTREDGGWMLRRSKRMMSDAEIHAAVRAEPARFSPNVLLRPVVESALLPTVAYVGGPAEISYFAQIGCLFHAHRVEAPLAVPRGSITIVEPRVRKVLDKFGLEPHELMRPFHEVATQIIHDELAREVLDPIARLRSAIAQQYAALADGASAIDPTLRGWVTGVRNQALGQLESAEKKITSHLKKRSEIELEQLRKATVSLYPAGVLQERMLNGLPMIARYGPGLFRDLVAAMEIRLDRPLPGWRGVDC
jgi:bacillithiol biosynthesis cysteine-adding enzyme BshC